MVIGVPKRNNRSGPHKTAKQKKAEAQAEAQGVAALLLMMLQAIAIQVAGPEAALLPQERQMINDPLARILARADKGVMERVQTYADPLMLGMGLLLWGSRLAAIVAAKRATPKPTMRAATPPAPATNGHATPAAEGELISASVGVDLTGDI